MSAQITGFILNEGVDPFALSRKTRDVFLPRLQAALYTELLEQLIESYDMASYSKETNKAFRKGNKIEKGALDFYQVLVAARKEQKEQVDESPDRYQVQLGFTPDPLTGRILCAWFGSHENLEVFSEFDEVEDFSYWNSSEGPEDISEEDWDNRIKVWDRALLPSSNISSSTLMSKVAAPHELTLNVSFDDIRDAGVIIPSREKRIKSLVQHFIGQEWYKEQENPTFNISGMFAAMRDPERVAKWTTIVSENLNPEEIDFDTLKDWTYNRKPIEP